MTKYQIRFGLGTSFEHNECLMWKSDPSCLLYKHIAITDQSPKSGGENKQKNRFAWQCKEQPKQEHNITVTEPQPSIISHYKIIYRCIFYLLISLTNV